MDISMSSRIPGRRVRLGEALRIARLRAGMTGRELATTLGISQGFVSKVENGKQAPSKAIVEEAARVLSCQPEETQMLTDLWEECRLRHRAINRSDSAAYQDDFLILEQQSRQYVDLEMDSVFPGQIATEDYSRETLLKLDPNIDDHALERNLEVRRNRASVLLLEKPNARFILHYSALADGTVAPKTQRDQLAHLEDLGHLPNIELRFVRPGSRWPRLTYGSWKAYDNVVVLETATTSVIRHEDPLVVSQFCDTFGQLWEADIFFPTVTAAIHFARQISVVPSD